MATFPSTVGAAGRWRLNDLREAQMGGNWPLIPGDEYFEYVTMLLAGNSTNGAQNNTFLDGSTNNFTITRNGNVTQGTFTPYGANWSNYFDGGGDYLTASGSFTVASNSFTFEGFIFPTANSTQQYIFDTGASQLVGVVIRSSNFQLWNGGSYENTGIAVSSYLNNWSHFALVRNGSSSLTLYLNGISVYTTTSAISGSSGTITIGANYQGTVNNFFGYISNFRAVIGTAVYTANFTPPTAPLTAITNTSLLTCQSNRLIDNSANNFTITRNGDVSVQVFSPFNPTAAYSAGTIGGSGYFDMDASGGVRTWLTASGTYSLSGDFTVEGFFYNKNISTFTGYNGVFSNAGAFVLYCTATTVTCGLVSFASPELGLNLSVSTPLVGSWVHFAIVRQSGSCALYLNGSRVSTASVASTISIANNLVIGNTANGNSGYGMVGYISDFQVTNGTAKYNPSSTTISVPTAPMSVSGKTVALQFTNAGVIDNAMMNDLETVGNAQISTTQSKWGGASIAFDGTGDGLYRPYSDLLTFNTGNFTVEFWMYFNSIAGFQTIASLGYTTIDASGWRIQTGNGTGKLNWRNSTTVVATDAGSTVNTGQWYHIAIVKNGSTTTIYRDGISVGSGTDNYNYNCASNAQFYAGGGSSNGFDDYFFNGYIDDLRITKGVARYTANFTPPAGPFKTF